jgi:hypothetical protein
MRITWRSSWKSNFPFSGVPSLGAMALGRQCEAKYPRSCKRHKASVKSFRFLCDSISWPNDVNLTAVEARKANGESIQPIARDLGVGPALLVKRSKAAV